MSAAARPATRQDLETLADLYHGLEQEMVALKEVWAITDGLPHPITESFAAHLDAGHGVFVGEYDGVPVGFLVWVEESLLPQSGGISAGVIRLIYTDPAARRVGVGEAMIERFLADAASRGIRLFDAIVPPGHRHAKNFFESNGFKARRIVMHRDDRAKEVDTDVG